MSLLSKSLSVSKYVIYTVVPGSYAITVLYDRFGNEVAEAKTDLKKEGEDFAGDLLTEAELIGAELIEDLKDVTLDIANATLDVIEGAGLAILSAGELAYDYTYSKVAPHRVEAVTVLTALTIYSITAVIIFKKIRGAN